MLNSYCFNFLKNSGRSSKDDDSGRLFGHASIVNVSSLEDGIYNVLDEVKKTS